MKWIDTIMNHTNLAQVREIFTLFYLVVIHLNTKFRMIKGHRPFLLIEFFFLISRGSLQLAAWIRATQT